ncbi:MAG: tetratricopeptide repeat protein [Spirulina sp. SIO3F2]|nr:tetratricopeptide repeat protein [Spirulina sp. SIO3F2]
MQEKLQGDSLFVQALERYQATLETLNSSDVKTWRDDDVMGLLITRDELQVQLDAAIAPPTNSALHITTEQRLQLTRFDQSLTQLGPQIASHVIAKKWHKTLSPPEAAWWWHFKPPVHALDHLDWLWTSIAAVGLTINLSLLSDIALRFLSGTPGFLSSLGALVPTLLTVASGGAFTKGGQQTLKNFLQSLRIPSYLHQEANAVLAWSLFALLFRFYSVLPEIANYYIEWGVTAHHEGNLATAQEYFERALYLDPNNAEAQFQLGVLYEDFNVIRKARTEYKKAIQQQHLESYNNLARLYIIAGKNGDAVFLLNQAILQVAEEGGSKQLEYALYKNLGWARLQQNRLPEAQGALEIAIDLEPDEGDPHCLLAQVLDQSPETQADALSQWDLCLQYLGTDSNIYADEWKHLANQRLFSDEASLDEVNEFNLPSDENQE